MPAGKLMKVPRKKVSARKKSSAVNKIKKDVKALKAALGQQIGVHDYGS